MVGLLGLEPRMFTAWVPDLQSGPAHASSWKNPIIQFLESPLDHCLKGLCEN